MNRKKTLFYLFVIAVIVLSLGLIGGAEYYFKDFVLHKSLSSIYNGGNPEFFKKPALITDIDAILYSLFFAVLKSLHSVQSFDDFVRQFPVGFIAVSGFKIPYAFPALLVNNLFALLGAFFTFFNSYILLKKPFSAFLAAIFLSTSYMWMCYSHHLAVDIPLSSLCITTVFFAIYFLQKKDFYTMRELLVLGLLSGLAASAKYNGLFVIVPVFAGIALGQKNNHKEKVKALCVVAISALVGFFMTNPFVLLDFGHFKSDFLFELNHSITGHKGSDDNIPFLFNLLHNLPTGFGLIPLLLALLGGFFLVMDRNIPQKTKIIFLSFPVVFYLYMSICSKLVFLRYMLPVIPFLAVLVSASFSFACERLKSARKYFAVIILVFTAFGLFQNINNGATFLRMTVKQDSRIGIKNIFKFLNVKNKKVYHSEIFSSYYYEEDFLNEKPDLTNDVRKYLFEANNSSISASLPLCLDEKGESEIFKAYDIVILDDKSFDKNIYIRKDPRFSRVENQYFAYEPYHRSTLKIRPYDGALYVVQVTPFIKNKEEVPFDFLRSDLKYRKGRGEFVEIYFKDKNLAKRFFDRCGDFQLECSQLKEKEQGFYYDKLANS